MEESEEPVFLYVYDLSKGMASQWGQALTGRRIDGIWHTSIVLFGMEVFYGQGIAIVRPPGTTHHGVPLQKMAMGVTYLGRQTIMEYLEGLQETYTADRYHLLDFNCNSFTNDVLGFLNGRSIPDEILNLPRDILATPFGQQMRPMIDQMFSGRSGPQRTFASSDSQTSNATLSTETEVPSTQSLSSNLQICTSIASFRSLLSQHSAVVAMFTSASSDPCQKIKPQFEDLALKRKSDRNRIQFALVEKEIGGLAIANEPLFGGPIQEFPTFVFFAKGARWTSCGNADIADLAHKTNALQCEVYPPHPHEKLSLPGLSKLTQNLAPVTYNTFPALPALSKRIDTSLEPAHALQPQTRTILSKSVIQYLATLPLTSAAHTGPYPPHFIENWIASTGDALDCLSVTDWFPVVDLWRLALSRDLLRLSATPSVVPFLLELILKLSAQLENGVGTPLLLTSIRLISNMLASPGLTQHLLASDYSPAVILIAVKSLLDVKESLRNAGAGLTWSLVSRCWALRLRELPVPDEDWQIEIGSAVLEALGRESESAEVVHRLTATIGLLLFQSPHYDALRTMLVVLGVNEVLERKKELIKSSKEAAAVLQDVEVLCA